MATDGFADVLKAVRKKYGKTFKDQDESLALKPVSEQLPPTGLVVDNPLFEFALDRRFLATGRCYLTYGKKSCSKTSLLFDLAKIFQKAGGRFIWIETENAPDFRYMRLQGLDDSLVVYENPKTLEQALTLAKDMIIQIRKSGLEIPIMLAVDSIAGGATEYERDHEVIGETKVGEHAKLMSAFYRNIVPELECINGIFVATNQLKEAIGKGGPGADTEALIGGEAQRFNSTYQFKVARVRDLTAKDAYGVERKIGSEHSLTVKRNKLGREGNKQSINYDLYIQEGIDWASSLVKNLKTKEYKNLIKEEAAGRVWWVGETFTAVIKDPSTGAETQVVVEKEAYDAKGEKKLTLTAEKLGWLMDQSEEAKEQVRASFGVPDMPSVVEETQVAEVVRKRRKKRAELEQELTEAGASSSNEDEL